MFERRFKEFINSGKAEYVNGNLRIVFEKVDERFRFLSAKHYGWPCPSMYTMPQIEDGNCDVRNSYWNDQKREHERGLFLMFTEDTYSQRVYLVIRVAEDLQSIIVKKDDYDRAGTVLNLK
jgi:hypothetical protein